MVFLFGYTPVGKTLHEVCTDLGRDQGFGGASVFMKRPGDPDDAPGKPYADGFDLREILVKRPELRPATVVNYNDFFGESVYRVVLPGDENGNSP